MAESEIVGNIGTRPFPYRIVVCGELGPVAAPFENLTVFSYSVIVGEIVDQAQLHGVLNWLGERGIQIVSVSPMDSSPERDNLGG